MEAYIAEAARLLRRGGLFVFEVEHRIAGEQRVAPDFNTITEREYSREDLQSLATMNGFQWVTTKVLPSHWPGAEIWLMLWGK